MRKRAMGTFSAAALIAALAVAPAGANIVRHATLTACSGSACGDTLPVHGTITVTFDDAWKVLGYFGQASGFLAGPHYDGYLHQGPMLGAAFGPFACQAVGFDYFGTPVGQLTTGKLDDWLPLSGTTRTISPFGGGVYGVGDTFANASSSSIAQRLPVVGQAPRVQHEDSCGLLVA